MSTIRTAEEIFYTQAQARLERVRRMSLADAKAEAMLILLDACMVDMGNHRLYIMVSEALEEVKAREKNEGGAEVELSYEGMPECLGNDIMGDCFAGQLVEMSWLWAVVYRFVVKEMRNKYEWMSVYYFLRKVGLLRKEDFKNFGKVMEQWYSSMPNYKPCTPDVKSHHHYMLTEPMENWEGYARRHKEDKRFKSSVGVCVTTIPQIKNLLSVFNKKFHVVEG